jgi:predicted DsbA family dithiol-disulfide isomerase
MASKAFLAAASSERLFHQAVSAPVRITYYLDLMSSWCLWAEPAWAELRERFAGRVDFEWRIALMNPGDFPVSRGQCEWFFRRSGVMVRSPFMLNSGWIEPARQGDYRAPNRVAEAARDLGAVGDGVRLALARAALREGKTIGDLAIAVRVAAPAGKLNAKKLRARAESAEIAARVAASTAEFFAHQLTQRPAFIVTDAIGDKAVFSGLASAAPLESMLADCAAYAAHAAHFGPPPKE